MLFGGLRLTTRIGGLMILCLAVASASAQSNNLLKNPNGNEGLQSWNAFGNGSVTDCPGLGKCFSIWQDAFIYQDVDVSESAVGSFALFVAFASIEEPALNGRVSGQPYIFGYFMSAGELRSATIFARLTGQEMASHPSTSAEWVKQYGVFKVPAQTGRIRIFLRSGCSKTAPSASCVSRFRAPGIFLFPNEDEAKAFVSTYQ